MESCNSGSLQSSSGGEEEYDSRATFMMGSVNPNPLPPLTPFFDPFVSTYPQNNSLFLSNTKTTDNSPFATSSQPPPPTTAPPHTAARNPKKRTRASRRAPTTVLTTDTSNFRAMVQEFTGIPSPPFSSSPFARSRLDLFASSLDAPPSYLSRPFAQKLQSPLLPPFLTGNNINVNHSNNTSSSALQSSNVFSNIVDQGFFLGTSANLQATHQKSSNNLFGLGSKAADDQVNRGSFIGISSSAGDLLHHHHQFGLGDQLKNSPATTFEGGLANLISSSSSKNASHGDKGFDYSSDPLASSFNGEKGQESSGRERYGGGDIDV